jgi:hypothetical protein
MPFSLPRTQGIVDQIDYRIDNQDCNLTLEDGESDGRTPFKDDKTLDHKILVDNGGTLDEIDDLQIVGFQIDDGSLWIWYLTVIGSPLMMLNAEALGDRIHDESDGIHDEGGAFLDQSGWMIHDGRTPDGADNLNLDKSSGILDGRGNMPLLPFGVPYPSVFGFPFQYLQSFVEFFTPSEIF